MKGGITLYSLLLRTYPRSFRDDVGGEMRRELEVAVAQAGGRRGAASVLARELWDLARNLPGAWKEAWRHRAKDDSREGRTSMMDGIGQDLRFALRAVRAQPGFSATVVALLALGIGGTTAAYSVVDGVLLEPLPYPEADELVYMYESYRGETRSVSYLNYQDWRERNLVFEDAGARTGWSFTLTGDGDAEELSVRLMSANLPEVLGVEPIAGRIFTAEEERREERLVVLSGELWARRFGSDASIVGRTLTLDAEPWTVVGVMPAGQEFPLDGADVFAPMTTLSAGDRASRTSHPGISVVGRLREGQTLEAARADMDAVAAAMALDYPESNTDAGVVVRSLRDRYLGSSASTIYLLAGAVGLVLVIVCANVANLFLARSQARTREAAVRSALGAGRARVARLHVLEALVLAALGGGIGVWLAHVAVGAFRTVGAGYLPRMAGIGVNGSVLVFAAVTCGVVALAVGLVPALRLAAADPAGQLREAGSRGGSPGGGRLRSALVVTEVALSFVLLVGAGLMLRSMTNLLAEDPGVDTDGVLTAYLPVPMARYPESADRARFYDAVLERVRDLPGVESAGAGDPLPLSGYDRQWSLSGEGLESVGDDGLRTDQANVTPGYFETLGIPVLAGRAFDRDESADVPTAVIDEVLAERLWSGESALGRQVSFSGDGPRVTVVGVVGHVRHYGVRDEARGKIYLPHRLNVWGLSLLLRTERDPAALVPELRRVVAEVDPAVPLDRVRTMAEYRDETMASELLATRVLGGFGVVALGLAMLGLYGVVAYSVSLRTREIGIRMAMGAGLRRVVGAITRQGLVLGLVGVGLGVGGSVMAAPLLGGLLFGVEPQDPVTFTAVGTLLVGVSALAALAPALRAGRVDPARTLRQE